MIKIKRFTIGVLILLTSISSCTENTADLNNQFPPHTLQVLDLEGIVGYWKENEVDKFTINFFVPNTIDSQITGIVEDLPVNFRTEGLVVIFSGEY